MNEVQLFNAQISENIIVLGDFMNERGIDFENIEL
jgi:hypothetical protein